MTLNKPSEEQLRDMLDEGQTLYQISRQFNMTVKEVYKLGKDYDIVYPYQIPKPTKHPPLSTNLFPDYPQEVIA